MQNDRSETKATVVLQKQAKNTNFCSDIYALCVDCLEQEFVPCPKVRCSNMYIF